MLRDIDGRNLKELVSRAISQVMSNDLALFYNLSGRNGKESFKKLLILSVLYGAFPCFLVNKQNVNINFFFTRLNDLELLKFERKQLLKFAD